MCMCVFCHIGNVPAVIDMLLLGRDESSRLDGLEVRIVGSTGIEYGPLVCLLVESLSVVDHHLGYLGILGVFGLGAFE